MEATRKKVAGADTKTIDAMTKSYMGSLLGKSRVEEAKRTGLVAKEGSRYAGWSERLKTAEDQLKTLQAKGKDRWWMPDEYEAEFMALESLLKDYGDYIEELPEGKKRKQVEEARKGLSHYLWFAARFGGSLHLWKEAGKEHGFEYTQALEALRAMPEEQQPKLQPEPPAAPEPQVAPGPGAEPQTGGGQSKATQPPVINNYFQAHYDHSMLYYPSTGEIERGPRFRQV